MPAGSVKTQADEVKWKRAKRLTRKQYGGIESKNKWPVVQSIYQNMKKSASVNSESIFWNAVSDELEKCGGIPMRLSAKIMGILRDPKKAKEALKVLQRAQAAKSRGQLAIMGPARKRALAKGFTGTKTEDVIKQNIGRRLKV